ncbi:MAG: methyltransferase domain-containing protein [Acidobacteria bacterium]|nr:methyltransferase domain-containing protein [Acidobacteriota bacterium]
MTDQSTPKVKTVNDQERFWRGDFGDHYIGRNQGTDLLAANRAFFAQLFRTTGKIRSLFEIGCNVGLNMAAARTLLPDLQISGVELNQMAIAEARRRLPEADLREGSLLQLEPSDFASDLALSKTVLIHIAPADLPTAYDVLHSVSRRYIVLAEYYSPTPVGVAYRGHSERLFKRDFAGEMLDRYEDLRLVDYGFMYHRDPVFPQDDINWFLLEKRA